MTGCLPYVTNLATRKVMAAESSNIHLMGHWWCDIIAIDSFLLKFTPFSIQLEMANPSFDIETTTSRNYNFVINKIQFILDMVLPTPMLG